MSTQIKKDQKNGIAKQPTSGVKAATTKPATDKKTDTVQPTLEERIQRVEELRSLTHKRHRTIETLHNIRTFNFASDDSCILILKDSQGQKFETGNTNLINLLKDYLVALLGDKVSSLDDEILAFKL